MAANEYKTCPYCVRVYKGLGFHGYCGRKCASEERGLEWVNERQKIDNIFTTLVVIGGSIFVIISFIARGLESLVSNPTLEVIFLIGLESLLVIPLIMLLRGRSKKKKSYENEIVHAGESIKKSTLVVKPDDFTNWFCFLTFNQIILGRYFILKKEKEILHIPIKDIRVCTKRGQKILMLFQTDERMKEMVLRFTKPTKWIQEIEQSGAIVISYRDYKKERNSVLPS